MSEFEIGKIYSRRTHIHARFGGQQQGGISTPASAPIIFLFSGESGEQYGYKDGWTKENVFLYTGEGQDGDMAFKGGNKAVKDHAVNGKDLLVFEALGKGQGYRFLGVFCCTSWEYRKAPDAKGVQRQVIVFHLIQLNDGAVSNGHDIPIPHSATPLEELRRRAMEASVTAPQLSPKESRHLYYERSEAVRQYVLARAAGVCEACRKSA